MRRKASVSYDEAIIRRLRKDPDFAAEYLKAALEEEDEPRVLPIALNHLAQAQGIAKVAKAAGIERESLYRARSVHGKLTHSSNLKVFENAIETGRCKDGLALTGFGPRQSCCAQQVELSR
jgi:probable addiction module antidote protein